MGVNPAGGSGEAEGRGSWCTPRWLADLLGVFYLDPCSNPRSHIRAKTRRWLEGGGDGLAERAGSELEVFINPPYARGEVIKWVRHYGHTRFCYLLRWDPSTDWFDELLPKCSHIWFPYRRINFEPPPGVASSSNPFPHALYMRDPPEERLDALAARGYLLPVDIRYAAPQSGTHDEHRAGDESGGADRGPQVGTGSPVGWCPACYPRPDGRHALDCPTYGDRY